ncbi:hypothetical protein OCGS_0985 [Oceaniovalibus guishaninsula JLT2003]|uniref:Uncharacterized protein n=1 Tax=Oceaniovalibus guishaninsula JLT2003 TaxID=1231392 RepID=K2I7G0_9RHOB|nr:hypothetical protein OCGS_0985 [Oceaniovalibus guishaninsula JLT2003]
MPQLEPAAHPLAQASAIRRAMTGMSIGTAIGFGHIHILSRRLVTMTTPP